MKMILIRNPHVCLMILALATFGGVAQVTACPVDPPQDAQYQWLLLDQSTHSLIFALGHISPQNSSNISFFYPFPDPTTIRVPTSVTIVDAIDLARNKFNYVDNNRQSARMAVNPTLLNEIRSFSQFMPVEDFNFDFNLLFSHDFEIECECVPNPSILDNDFQSRYRNLVLWYNSKTGVLYSPAFPGEYCIAPQKFQAKMRNLRAAMPVHPNPEGTYWVTLGGGVKQRLIVGYPLFPDEKSYQMTKVTTKSGAVIIGRYIPENRYDGYNVIKIINGHIKII